MADETAIGGAARDFPLTRWTLIRAAQADPAAKSDALASLLAAYWKPLYFYVRRKGRTIETAKDVVQGFCAQILERDLVSRLDPDKGRFRAYLRASMDHYLANLHEHDSAQKRGGGRVMQLDIDPAERDLAAAHADPHAAFDREWAVGVMERAMKRLRDDLGPKFDSVAKFFEGDAPAYADAARASGMSVVQFKAFLHRVRAKFRDLVRAEVSHTVDGDPDAEIRDLMELLS